MSIALLPNLIYNLDQFY